MTHRDVHTIAGELGRPTLHEGKLEHCLFRECQDAVKAVGSPDNPPKHYQGEGMQPFDIIDAYGLDFYEGNALKYLLRWRKKGGTEDLRKSRHYIDELIQRAELMRRAQ